MTTRWTWNKSSSLCICIFSALATVAQSLPIAPTLQPGSAQPGIAAVQSVQHLQPEMQYFGGVPTGRASPEVLPLSLRDAVDRGLRQNLGALLSSDAITAARGQRWEALSDLLPTITTDTAVSAHQLDVKATIGLQIPHVPAVTGPFGVFDTRAYFKQSVLNWESIERARSSREQLEAAKYSYKDARELVVLAVTASYLLAIADQARVDSAESQQRTAQALFQQSSDQQKAGIAAAIDVLRAHVELQARQQELIAARNALDKQKLVLARVIGLPPGQKFEIATNVDYEPTAFISLDEALKRAYTSRADFRSANAEVHAANLMRKAAAAERLPTIGVEADYGDIGVNPATSHGTVNAAAVLRIPIFQGGKVHGDVLRADATLSAARQRLENLRGRIDQDVRNAFFDLKATSDQVLVAKSSVQLASQTLQQAKDRFASGVTDNIEVVQAQDAVAAATESYISSLYNYNITKISMAKAIGIAESSFEQYLKGK